MNNNISKRAQKSLYTAVSIVMLMTIILAVLCASGCRNVSEEFDKTDKGTKEVEGFFDSKKDNKESKIPPFTVSGNNNNVNLGDSAIKSETKETVTKEVQVKTAWDMTLREAYEAYSPYTFILIGIGLLIIVWAYKSFSKTVIGKSMDGGIRALTSIVKVASSDMENTNTDTEEYKYIEKYRRKVADKLSKLKDMKR